MMRRVTRKSISAPLEDFRNPEDGNLSLSSRFSLSTFVKRVEKLTDDQRKAINKTGFGNLLLLPHQMLSKNLLAELMDHWSSEKRAFELLSGTFINITLMDIALILGLPVVGQSVILTTEEHEQPMSDYFHKHFCGKRMIEISSIENKLISLQDSVTDEFVRTFLLFTIGTLLFPNPSGKVDSRYICFLDNLDAVSSFSWGAAVLEDLISWLNKRKENNVLCIGGCLIFLQIWSFEHIDIARPSMLVSNSSFPRACRWENTRAHQRKWFSTKFKELRDDQIIWTLQPTSSELKYRMVKELLEAENDKVQLSGKEHSSLILSRLDVVDEVDLVLNSESGSKELDEHNLTQPKSSGLEFYENHDELIMTSQDASSTSTNGHDDSITRSRVLDNQLMKPQMEKENRGLINENILLREQLENLRNENERLRKENLQVRDECSSIKSAVHNLQSENHSLRRSANRLVDRLEDILLEFDDVTIE